MKYGDKIYTYKDIEEAKKLIGNKVIACDYFGKIERAPEASYRGSLTNIVVDDYHPFVINDNYTYQFIREVIDEPQYRPFKGVFELIKHWEKNYGNSNRPNGTMPLIWVQMKKPQFPYLITAFTDEQVYISGCGNWETAETLFSEYEFLDGKPCGVEVKE